jgi:hypothetical protein
MRREDRRESDTSKGGRRRWREVNPRYVRHPKGRDRCSAAPPSACLRRFLPSCIQDGSESSGVLRRNRSRMRSSSNNFVSHHPVSNRRSSSGTAQNFCRCDCRASLRLGSKRLSGLLTSAFQLYRERTSPLVIQSILSDSPVD